MDFSNWIALAALLGTAVGYFLNRRQANNAAKKAERATLAAERSADAQESVARILEGQTIEASQDSSDPHVAWRLTYHAGDTYMLENAGTSPAHDVDVRPAGENVAFRPPRHATTLLEPGESVTFIAGLSYDSTDDRMLVRWKETPTDEAHREWYRPLPPKR